MKQNNKNVTMEDVARLAGVSIGTVGRVAHNHGEVSEKTRRKVLRIIDEIGYKPNIHASILSQKRHYSIVVIIPYFQKGEYWELIYGGIMKAEQEAQKLNVQIKVFYYSQFEIESFRAACRNAAEAKPNGVLIAPIYKEATRDFLSVISPLAIPVVYIDSKPEFAAPKDYLAYFGMPLYESGYLAADLLLSADPAATRAVSFTIDRGELTPNDSFVSRDCGFRAYLAEMRPGCVLDNRVIYPYDFMRNIKVFDDYFAENPEVRHIVTFTSRGHLIADWMELRGVKDKTLVAFDMLGRNMESLKSGMITNLIAERTDKAATRAVKALVDHLVLRQDPPIKDIYSSIDILNRYNIDYYLPVE